MANKNREKKSQRRPASRSLKEKRADKKAKKSGRSKPAIPS